MNITGDPEAQVMRKMFVYNLPKVRKPVSVNQSINQQIKKSAISLLIDHGPPVPPFLGGGGGL